MMDILVSLFPICVAIILGMFAGRFLPKAMSMAIRRWIGYFVWILLFAIGYKFGLVLDTLKNVGHILFLALIFSVGLSLCVGGTVYVLYHRNIPREKKCLARDLGIRHVLKECAWALLSLMLGIGVAQLLIYEHGNTQLMPSTETFLYVLLFMIGVDIINSPFQLHTINRRILFMPIPIIISSSIGGIVLAWLLGMDVRYGLLFSGGYGWFSLSGIMVTAHVGEFYGATALLTDLFRELIAIVVLFFVGARYPNASIAISGATAMDTTLPIIKKTAGNAYIVQAIYIGAIFTLIVPFWLGFLLSLVKEFGAV